MSSGGSKNFERGEHNLSVPLSFIANAHNELYSFYTEKGGFLKKKNLSQYIGAAAPTAPLESATVNEHSLANILQYKFGDVQ